MVDGKLAEQHHSSPGILFVNRSALLGGTDRILLLCIRTAQKMGLRVILACPGEGRLPDEARAMGIPVEPCSFEAMQRSRDPRKLLAYIRGLQHEGARVQEICSEHHISLIHVHGPISAMYAVKAARTLKLPVVCHMHEAMPPTLYHRLAWKYASPVIARYVCVSQEVCRLASALGFPDHSTHLIYNAVDPSFLADDILPADDIVGAGPHIGLVGLIAPIKGQQVFLEAAEKLAGSLPEARFYIIGSLAHPADQPYLDRLHQTVETSQLAGRVVFLGYRADIPNVMRAMDVVTAPTTQPEAFGLVAAEAMALGRLIVASHIGGLPEIIEDGVTGRLVPPNDAGALARAIEDLASRPADDPMRGRAEKSIRDRFSPERFEADLMSLYSSVLHLS